MSGKEERVELWLVRHGETTSNAAGMISGWKDVHLSEKGRAMAEALRPILKDECFDTVVASDLTRAQDTARLAHSEPAIDGRLRELDFGKLEGMNWETMPPDLQREILAFSEECAPGGELISVFEARVFDYLASLPAGRHLLFVHGGVIRIVLRQVGADQFVPPTSVAVVDWSTRSLIDLRLAPHN